MKFYCTAGRGTEGFLKSELEETFKKTLHEVSVTDGKVFFELNGNIDEMKNILELKTAERAFVQVFLIRTGDLDQRNLIHSIKSRLNNKQVWYESMAVLGELQSSQTVGKGDNSADSAKQKDIYVYESIPETIEEPECKKPRQDENEICEEVTFRVNFKCPACFRKRLNIKSAPKQIGMHIKHLTGWKIDLRHPLVEICIQLNNEFLTVGFPLTREPLSKRSFIKLIGLRSTVAHIMSHLLQIQPGDIVLDPLCGKATVLLEAAHFHKCARYIGIDKSETQLHMARENIGFAHVDNIELINGDSTDIPLPDGSIEKVATDAPFGNNHTTDIPLEQFYRKLLQEIARVLMPSGRLVILTSCVMKNFIASIIATTSTLSSNKNTDGNCTSGQSDNFEEIANSENDTCSDHVYDRGIINEDVEVQDTSVNLKQSDNCCDVFSNYANRCYETKRTVSQHSTQGQNKSEFSRNGSNAVATDIELGSASKLVEGFAEDSKDADTFLETKIHTVKPPAHKLYIGDTGTETNRIESNDNKTDTHIAMVELPSCDTLRNGTSFASETKGFHERDHLKSLLLLDSHYIKLGETHSYICVLEKIQ